jgi:hypothetical protein
MIRRAMHGLLERLRAARPASPWDRATAAVLICALLLVAATFRDYGSTWDERFQRAVGMAAVAWWSTGGADTRALEGGETGNLNLYGGLFEGAGEIAAAVLPFDPLESRHLVIAVTALLGVLGTALLARRLGGPRAGFFAAVLLLTTPGWWGHGFANSKDVPFAAPYPWLVLAFLKLADDLPRVTPRRVVAAGLALGAGLAARPGGLVLVIPLACAIVAVRAVARGAAAPPGERAGIAAGAAGGLVAAIAIAWVLMLLTWPYGLTHPLAGPAQAIDAARSHPWNGLVRFAGAWHPSTSLPRSYAPGWFLASLPESWHLVALAGVWAAASTWRRARPWTASPAAWLDPLLVAAAGFGPILAAVVTRPILYDGVRHLLFTVPALAALFGWILSATVDRLPRPAARIALASAAALAALAAVDAARLHPYEYVYFNRAVAGGLAAASRDFELDYWGAAGREAMAWVVENVRARGGGPVSVTTTADPSTAEHWIEGDTAARARFLFVPGDGATLHLATTRWFSHRSTGRVLHVVERMGVPLLYVIDTADDGGRLVLEAGDLALTFPPGSGWRGRAVPEAGDERARYALVRARGGTDAMDLLILTPRTGPVPDERQLREEVAAIARSLPEARRGMPGEPTPLRGPVARGWAAPAGDSRSGATVAGLRVGDAAVLVVARHASGDAGALELLDWLQGARLAPPPDRRPP